MRDPSSPFDASDQILAGQTHQEYHQRKAKVEAAGQSLPEIIKLEIKEERSNRRHLTRMLFGIGVMILFFGSIGSTNMLASMGSSAFGIAMIAGGCWVVLKRGQRINDLKAQLATAEADIKAETRP